MKQVSLTKFKQMTATEIKDSGCINLVADGETIAIVVIGAVEEMKQRITGNASMIDLARGK